MKYVAITLVICVASVFANPILISGNKIGDIVTVRANANAVLSSSIDQNVISGILGLINQQAAVVGRVNGLADTQDDTPTSDIHVPSLPNLPIAITPELIEKFTQKLNPIN